MNSKNLSVAIIEDNPDIRSGFELLINSTEKYNVIGTFENCEEGIEAIKIKKPEIVLMDIDLPGMNGIEGTAIIKNLLPKTEIIIITVFENTERVFGALCAGASGYLTKNSGYNELIFALDEVSAGGAPMSANIARMVVRSFAKNNSNSPLTKKETEVISLLSEGKSYKSISQALDVSLDTIKFHIKNIYIKLQVNNREDAIAIAKKNKYI